MIEFIQKQIEASERLFEMMRSDHDTRMKEMEHWARTTQSLIEKLHERDMTIDMLKKWLQCFSKRIRTCQKMKQRTSAFENPERRLKIMEKQLEAMAEQVKRLKDENEALRLDLGLKVHGL
jgi:predicted RNase H-like nuclease (RuvC/YqgF family)